MAESKPSGILYVEPNRLLFYSTSLNKVLFQDFPPDTVSDLDIINKEKFNQILTFFIQNALQKVAYDLTLVFSQQTSFEKVLVPTISKDIDASSSEFTSLVPFEEVLSKVYKDNKDIKAYAVNRVYYEFVADCFMRNGSAISLVLPASLIIEKNPELSSKFDLPSVASKVESMKAYNMVDHMSNMKVLSQEGEAGKKKNKRTYVLLGVFIVLLIFMLIFGYNTFSAQPKTKSLPAKLTKPVPTAQKENITQPSPTVIPVASTSAGTPVSTNSSRF